jgi:transposase-like protein
MCEGKKPLDRPLPYLRAYWAYFPTMNILPPINPAIPRCPRCRPKDMITKGMRKTRHEARQRWGCNRCGHTFTNLVTNHSPYPVKIIMEAICRYNLGYSARNTVRYLTC